MRCSKLNERSGNVYENKGLQWKTVERSGNVIENTGSYAPTAMVLVKTKDLSCTQGPGSAHPLFRVCGFSVVDARESGTSESRPGRRAADLGKQVCATLVRTADLGQQVCATLVRTADLGKQVCATLVRTADLGQQVCATLVAAFCLIPNCGQAANRTDDGQPPHPANLLTFSRGRDDHQNVQAPSSGCRWYTHSYLGFQQGHPGFMRVMA